MPAIEKAVRGVRLDEKTVPAVDVAGPDRAMNEPAVPRHRQVMVVNGQPVDLIVAHAVVLGEDDVHPVTAPLELAAEAEDDLAQSTRLRHRSALRRNHYNEHTQPSALFELNASRTNGTRFCASSSLLAIAASIEQVALTRPTGSAVVSRSILNLTQRPQCSRELAEPAPEPEHSASHASSSRIAGRPYKQRGTRSVFPAR